ncbi:ATP-dependent DNA helicase PIF1-like [Mercenaria mercenaria]|uniref:ATP-dependent DNA helicase PIF1-like n=1 Tax=Mercenaria mercenaria TaxID=6596 RepID=UPI00234F2EBE|nr:ATP-dependent DNA helicase PIF1-like [Mercenaria mercenaria]
MAPTGKAAYHIRGSTIHNAMKIAANQKLEYRPLPSSTLNTFRNLLGDVKLIFIDEISMVGFRMFHFIHLRLQELKQSKEDFGGISIIVIGDLFQLKPVHDSYIFQQPNSSYMPLATSLWFEHFPMYELTQIMRQRECRDFALLLNILREANNQLPNIVQLVEGCVYDLTVNLDTTDGLTNGATCTVMKFNRSSNNPVGPVWVKFNDDQAGQSLRTGATMRNFDRSWTPLPPVSRQFPAGYKGQAQVQRLQYPLRPAAAKTIHRSQGDTMDTIVVD